MPRWLTLCAVVAAAVAVGAWEAFRGAFPFFAFAVREIWKTRRPSLVCQPSSFCNLAPDNFTMTQEEIDMHAVFSPYLGREDTERIYSALQEGYELRRQQAGAGRPVVLHIGPADLPVAEEIEMYSRISATMNATEVLFVEPHPGQRERLREKMRKHFDGELSIRILPAAACPNVSSEVTFYRISERFFQDFGGERWYFTRYWSGLNKANFVTELQYYNKNNQAQLMKALNLFPQGFPETDEDWFPYIEEIPVLCHTPQVLLRELTVEPTAVAMLIMDSEGYDTELMISFMSMVGFAPNFIMFEWHLHANEPGKLGALLGLVRELHARGYEAPDCRPAKRSRFSTEPDLVVEVEGDEFRLHSVLLMLSSRVFRRLLESGMRETQEGRIRLKGKSRQEFLEVLPFLTTVASTPRVTADTVPVLLQWADEYEIDAAKKACEEFLMTQEANSIEALSQAVDFNLQRRIRQCIKAISADIYIHWHDLRPFAKNSGVMEVLWPAIFKAAKVQLPQEDLSSSPSLEALWPLLGAAVERLSPMERPAPGLPVKVIDNLELAKALCEATPGILHWPSEKDRVVGKWGTIRSVKNEVAVVQFGGGTAHTWSFPCSALLCRR